ncbi:YegP family protein [Arthrobacter sp. PAMC25284]|uniref:YegP family protein n=1 Tax=Arthrobacter sp. PAMC25284 TaxID=2861279 RepID=UPI001C626765|nr:YegP family protein [Arthrobacter sp. PAMC25284]QYF91134.1 YegP family protein [Arthrobacter sp. PAMC25284]
MAGQFELFTDAESRIRFRLVAKDGSVLAVSTPFEDKRAAADAIRAVRECAGTGLIKEVRSSPWAGSSQNSGSPSPAHRRHRHAPAV